MEQPVLDLERLESGTGLRLVPSPPSQCRRPSAHRWIARLLQIIFFANILIIVGLWANGGNLTDVHSENVDVVSSATDTSEAYVTSLQATVKKA